MGDWTFIHIADMQPGSPRSFRYRPELTQNWQQAQQQIRELAPELLLVGGDLTRDGYHDFELAQAKADLDGLAIPYHVIAGNMDTGNKHTDRCGCHRAADQCTDLELNVTSEQLQRFSEVFGPLWWSFDHKDVRFSGFTDVVVNSGLPEEAAFWQWAEAQRARLPARHHVWTMHYALFADDPHEPDWYIVEHYTDWYFCVDQPGRARLLSLFKDTHTDIVFSGHIHCRHSVVAAGIRFERAPAISFGQWPDRWADGDTTLGFTECTVTDDGIKTAFVPLARTFPMTESYGLGGHPAPHARDYSLAWEQEPDPA
jgi:hypothetical protein